MDSEGAQLEFEEGGSPLDFDLSQFNTYVRTLKFMMKSMFQTIMYRMFRNGRGDMELYQKALSM